MFKLDYDDLSESLRGLKPEEYQLWSEMRERVNPDEGTFAHWHMWFGDKPQPDSILVEREPGEPPFPLSHWRWGLRLPTDSVEERYWSAITHALRADERQFEIFLTKLGRCPPGHELREIPGRRRPGFKLEHFEWVPMSAPRSGLERIKSLRETQEQIRRLELAKLSEPAARTEEKIKLL